MVIFLEYKVQKQHSELGEKEVGYIPNHANQHDELFQKNLKMNKVSIFKERHLQNQVQNSVTSMRDLHYLYHLCLNYTNGLLTH